MLKNNKGFTVVELIMSFVFSSILAVSLFAVILNYRDKQVNTSIETRLLAFKSELIIDVKQDIQKYGLKSMEYCTDASGKRQSRCVVITFMNGKTKSFIVKEEPRVDTLDNLDGTADSFYYSVPYISYGGVKYSIPDAANVSIRSDFLLESTTAADGLETNNPLYKIRVNLIHNDLDADMDISIVAEGALNVNTGSAPYRTYNVGDRVSIILNRSLQKYFRVIKRSTGYENKVLLIYDDSYDSTVPQSYQFNSSRSGGNIYESSSVKSKVDNIASLWINADTVRLITSEEVAYLVAACPSFKKPNASNLDISSVSSWILNTGTGDSGNVSKNYWTMSQRKVTNDTGQFVWYINSSNKKVESSYVDASYAIRPVIEIGKEYIAY